MLRSPSYASDWSQLQTRAKKSRTCWYNRQLYFYWYDIVYIAAQTINVYVKNEQDVQN